MTWNVLRVISVLSLIDLVIVLTFQPISYPYPWVAAFLRPIYLLFSIRILREYSMSYIYVIKDSMSMVLFIVVFILYFSWMGQRLFSGTLEGV